MKLTRDQQGWIGVVFAVIAVFGIIFVPALADAWQTAGGIICVGLLMLGGWLNGVGRT